PRSRSSGGEEPSLRPAATWSSPVHEEGDRPTRWEEPPYAVALPLAGRGLGEGPFDAGGEACGVTPPARRPDARRRRGTGRPPAGPCASRGLQGTHRPPPRPCRRC